MDAVRAHEAQVAAEAEHEWRLLEATESIEAEESHWRGVFAANPNPDVQWTEGGVDGRLFNRSGMNHAGGS